MTMKRNYITPQSISLKLFTEDALMNTSTMLSDETNDDDAIQWSQKQNNDNNGGGLWQYMDE